MDTQELSVTPSADRFEASFGARGDEAALARANGVDAPLSYSSAV